MSGRQGRGKWQFVKKRQKYKQKKDVKCHHRRITKMTENWWKD